MLGIMEKMNRRANIAYELEMERVREEERLARIRTSNELQEIYFPFKKCTDYVFERMESQIG